MLADLLFNTNGSGPTEMIPAGPAAARSSRTPVTAFVDWTAQMHNAKVRSDVPVLDRARLTLGRTANLIRRALGGDQGLFRVSLRLYHGWHKGWEATADLKATTQVVADEDFRALSSQRVSFSQTVEYGHTLLEALPERRHGDRVPPVHLANTLREQERGQPLTEKMVDTALAADLLAWARSASGEWALVLSEDDDLVPPLFTAEAWVKQQGGRTLLVRRRRASQYTLLAGLLRQP